MDFDTFSAEMIRTREKTISDPLRKRSSEGLGSLSGDILSDMHLLDGLRRQTVFNAWNEVSGAGRYTVGMFLSDGILYVSMSSSVVRSQLSFQLDGILMAMNRQLAADKVFVNFYGGNPHNPVRKIVLK